MTPPPGSSLRPIEIASGLVFGVEDDRRDGRPPRTALAALEDCVLAALTRPPCLVSFSGGRDSSCVLALATHVARREGLAPPVPVTLRFPELPESDESEWQELVLAHLGLDDWLRLEPGDDLDAVGPVASRALRRHGLLWPFNAYVHVPMLEAARHGSLLTGIGGDELFEYMAPARLHAVLARRVGPVPRDALRLGLAASPWRLRQMVLRRRSPLGLPWLTGTGRHELADAWATELAREPRRLASRAVWWAHRRALRVALRSLDTLAADEDVRVASPLSLPEVATAIHGDPSLAFADRAGRLRGVFGLLLLDEVYERRSKASFNRAFFGPWSRAVVGSWQGDGVDTSLVEVDALRTAWSESVPDGRTFTLLQSLTLLGSASRAGDPPPLSGTTSSEGAEARSRAERPA